MTTARARSEGSADSAREGPERRASGSKGRDDAAGGRSGAAGPLWSALATGMGGAEGRVQRKCAACRDGGAPCPSCAGDEEKHAIQRKPGCSCGGSCPACRAGADPLEDTRVQPKLTLGPVDDRYEREADAVASAVMRKSTESVPTRASDTLLQRACAECGGSESAPGRDSGHGASTGTARGPRLDRVRRVIGSPGSGTPVAPEIRSRTEPVLGADLSGVRVHADPRSRRAALDIGARAFTHGGDIFLGAGQSPADPGLMAHELTHTVQQGASPLRRGSGAAEGAGAGRSPHAPAPATSTVQRIGIPFVDLPSGEDVLDAASDVGGAIREKGEAAYEWGAGKVGAAYEKGSEVAGAVYEGGSRALDWAGEKAAGAYERGSEAVDWAREKATGAYERVRGVASDVLDTARSVARKLGGMVSISGAGVEVSVPTICPESSLSHTFVLDPMTKEFMVPVGTLPLGSSFAAVGKVGVVGRLQPRVGVQAGPFCLRGVRILMNPLTGDASVSGSLTATAAVSLGAEARGGIRGAVSLDGVIPIGQVPVPISIPVVGVEGGVAGLVQGIGAGTLTVSGGWSVSGGALSMSQRGQLDLGLAGDVFLGAYGQLDVGGQNFCRLYWQPYRKHAEIAGSLGVSIDLSMGLGGLPSLDATLHRPTFSRIPFDDIPLALSREGFTEDCPLRDDLCRIFRALNLLPSQRGGEWSWDETHPWGPGRRLSPRSAPLTVYEKDPGRASGAQCRGACGPDCRTCERTAACRYTDPATGDIWMYTNFQHCKSNEGCREHDAAFDWAADVHGETSPLAIVYPWHMAANLECTCNNLAGNCVAWVFGLPPYDMDMFFAEFARRMVAGGGTPPPAIAGLPECRPPEGAEGEPEAEEEGREVVENPLTAARARTIPDLADKLDDPEHYAGTVTLVGGASAGAGILMISRYITDQTDMGSRPRGQDELYGYGKLPSRKDAGQPGYEHSMVFVKGHLLNYHHERGLGGEGEERNLFPITEEANRVHSTEVEKHVKDLVHTDGFVVMYQVVVGNVDGPHLFDAFDDDPTRECVYQYINADFLCEYATYRLYSDGSIELNEPTTHDVDEDFDEEAFRERVRDPNAHPDAPCPGKPSR